MQTCNIIQTSLAVGAHGFQRRFPSSSFIRPSLLIIKADNRGESRSVAVCSGRHGVQLESEKREFDESVITEEEVNAIGKMRGKCDGGGIAELLECLEKEAIMGDDDGKEPTDYSRRAMIFDKSSKVFQALKDGNSTTNLPV